MSEQLDDRERQKQEDEWRDDQLISPHQQRHCQKCGAELTIMEYRACNGICCVSPSVKESEEEYYRECEKAWEGFSSENLYYRKCKKCGNMGIHYAPFPIGICEDCIEKFDTTEKRMGDI